MKRPVYYEDVAVGDELPAIEREPITTTQLVMYCGVAGVSDPIHFDIEVARANGFPEIVVNASLRVAFLAQMLAAWAMPEGWIRRLTCQHRGLVLRGDQVTSRGRVLRKYVEGDAAYVECEIWNETARAGRADIGSAVLMLPRREAAA